MASSVIGSLRVNLGLDSARFSRGMTEAQKRLKVARAQFVGVAGAAAAFGAALTAAAIKGAQEIDRVAKAARRLDTSIAGFRAMELAAGEAGVSMSSLTNDVQTMNREIANIGKTGNAQRALDALGLAASDLAGKDADEQLATLADRITDMGLSAGETTAILRDLGVRNREMVLALMGGGDVFRNARKDVEDYGLALSAIDAAKIETANDQLGRLGVVTQYVGQQLALALVPALGSLAEAFTNSMREGGLLRTVIDGLIDNLDRLALYAGAAVTWFGVKYVAAMVAATTWTGALSAALVALRTAIARTGVGLLVIGAAELVIWLGRVIKSAGGIVEAFKRVFDVGKAVFLGVGNTAWGLMNILAGVASSIAGSFLAAFALIGKAFDTLINGMASAWNMLADSGVGETLGLGALGESNVGGKIQDSADAMFGQAVESINKGSQRIIDAGKGVADAVAASIAPIDVMDEGMVSGAAAADQLADALDGVAEAAGGGGGGGGGSGGGAAPKIKEVGHEMTTLERGVQTFKSSVASAFEGLITGANSFKEALAGVLKSLASVFAQAASSALFGPDLLGGLIPGFATGTPYAPGGLAMVGERGPELVNLPRGSQVLNANQTRGAMGGGGGVVRIVIEENEMFASRVRTEATGVAVEVTRKGISQNNRAQSDARYLRGGS